MKRTKKLSKSAKVKHHHGPDWDKAVYVYKGRSPAHSYDHHRPQLYVRKCDRPGTTGLYKYDNTQLVRRVFDSNTMVR